MYCSTISPNQGAIYHPISENGLTTSDIPNLSDFELLKQMGDDKGLSCVFRSAIEKKSEAKCGIRVMAKNKVKLCDFGLSEYKANQIHLFSGTPNYVAPEIRYTRSKASEKSDLYSLGLILYVMCRGALPGKKIIHFYCHLSQEYIDLVRSML